MGRAMYQEIWEDDKSFPYKNMAEARMKYLAKTYPLGKPRSKNERQRIKST